MSAERERRPDLHERRRLHGRRGALVGAGRRGRGRPDRRRRHRRRGRRPDRRPAPRCRSARGGCSCRGSRTRTSIRSPAASTCSSATCTTSSSPSDYLRAIEAYAEAHPERAVDPRRWMVDGCVPGRHADRRRSSIGSSPTGRCTSRTATATAPGSTRGRSSSPGSRGTRPIRPTAASSATPTASRTGTLHEGAADLVGSPRASAHARGDRRRCSCTGQSYLHCLGITAWQDAIVDDQEDFGRNYAAYLEAAGRRHA